MANTPQAKKRIRRNANRAQINGARMSRIRSFVKKVETALAGGDKQEATEALRTPHHARCRACRSGSPHSDSAAPAGAENRFADS